jgi:class 3 adenylate cyclase
MLADIPEYLSIVQAYLAAVWQTVDYFYQPQLAAIVGGVAVVSLLLRVFLGGLAGWLVRTAIYLGLLYFVATNSELRLLFPNQAVATVVAALMIVALWLPVTMVGGTVRLFRRNGRRDRRQPAFVAAPIGAAAHQVAGTPFDVVRREDEKKKQMVIMMTDIVGYSARMEKDEAATFTLLKEHNTIMRRAITTHRGKEIKTIGDAFMVVFENPLDALRCAIVMQTELHKFNKPRPVNDQLKVRIGIHRGEVIIAGKDVFGEGVNIAARMESITDPGGISISADVYEHVKNKVEAGFQSIGTPKMKNISNPPEVFRVHLTQA